ncbi:STAS domain-containing protein [Streptomyces sp. NPDC012746]|uniref:STAS domain-containing protein n=1 Tax=Streptomyces sp. NPDC012746 TaxID=3364845 RepID=UPI0036BE8782
MPQSRWRSWRTVHGPGCPVHVHRRGHDGVEASLHGEIRAQDAPLIGNALARLLDESPPYLRIDLADAEELSATTAGTVFFPLVAAARRHGTTVTVHRAGPRTRAKLRELGLDLCVTHHDTSA